MCSCNLYIQCILTGAPTRIRSQSLRTVGNLWPGHHDSRANRTSSKVYVISYLVWPSTCRLDDVSISISSVTNMLFIGSKRTGYFLNKNVNFGCLSWNFSSAFTPNATGRQDPIQSERIDAYRANFFDLSRHTFAVHRRVRSRGFVAWQIRSSWNISTLTRISRDDSQSAFNSVATEWHV